MHTIVKKIGVIVSVFTLIITSFVVVPQSASACSCIMPVPPQQALEQSVAVFSGTVTTIVEGSSAYKVSFIANTFWKGNSSGVVTITTPQDSAACGFSFEMGKTYIVYAHETEDGQLGTTLCSRTHELQADDQDVIALGTGSAVPTETTQQPQALNYNTIVLSSILLILLIPTIIFVYIPYAKHNPNHFWFKRKLYGWGWTPVTWQGWGITLIYIVGIIAASLTIDKNSPIREIMFTAVLPIVLLTIAFIRIAYKKGESPRWQWGPEKND